MVSSREYGARSVLVALGVLAVSASLGCGPGGGGVEGDDEAGDEDGEDGGPPCSDEELEANGWTSTRTAYPEMRVLWSDGVQTLAYGEGSMLVDDGQSLRFVHGLEDLNGWLLEARSVDDAWLAGSGGLRHWDGESLSLSLSVTPGQIVLPDQPGTGPGPWAIADSYVFEYDGDSWIQHGAVPSEVAEANALAVGPNGELWAAGLDGAVAHLPSADGEWEVELLDVDGLEPDELWLDDEGALWLVGAQANMVFARRDAGGTWTVAPAGASAYRAHISPASEGIAVYTQGDYGEASLYTWTGGAELPTLRATGEELGYARTEGGDGPAGALMMLAGGPELFVVDLEAADPVTAEVRAAFESAFPSRGQAAGVDAAFELVGERALRWDLEASVPDIAGFVPEGASTGRWVESFVAPAIDGGEPEVLDFFPEGADQGWVLIGSDSDTGVVELWRWQGGGLDKASWQPDGNPSQLRGSGPEDVWAFESDAGVARAWRYDGQSWTEVLGADEGVPTVAGSIHDGSATHIIGTDGLVRRWQGAEWTVLGEPLLADVEDMSVVAFVQAGDEVVARVSYPEGWDFPEIVYETHRFDGANWTSITDAIPDFDPLAGDGQGYAWGVVQSQAPGEPHQLHRHGPEGSASGGWGTEPAVLDDSGIHQIIPAEDGVVVHGRYWTHTYRRACAQ